MESINGTVAQWWVITEECRKAKGDEGALNEAYENILAEYRACVEGWKDAPEQPVFNLVLTIERPEPELLSHRHP